MNIEMTWVDIFSLAPLLIILFGSLALLMIESFAPKFSRCCAAFVTIAILLCALISLHFAPMSDNKLLTDWLRFDALSYFFTLFFLLIGIGASLLAYSFFQRFEATQGEYYFLLLAALFGLILMAMSADFLTLFLGVETLSISLYVLCGYLKKWKLSHESSVKYFLMGSIAAAFLLYGIALIYGATGTTRFDALYVAYQALTPQGNILFLCGIGLVTLALAFEAAIVPVQVWAPDVYESAPSPVTAFMAVGTKVGAFAAFIRVFFDALPEFNLQWNEFASWLVYPTLIYANFIAMRQTQLKRFFAYSGISHAGFLLIPVVVGTPVALSALLFYLIVYACATLGAFSIIAFLDMENKGVYLSDLKGLFQRSPFLAFILGFCLLTLAGIPPTIGFFAKFYIFQVAFEAGYYGLVIVGLLTTILAVYYYLRIIGVMLTDPTEKKIKFLWTWASGALGIICFVCLVVLSFFPGPWMEFVSFTT